MLDNVGLVRIEQLPGPQPPLSQRFARRIRHSMEQQRTVQGARRASSTRLGSLELRMVALAHKCRTVALRATLMGTPRAKRWPMSTAGQSGEIPHSEGMVEPFLGDYDLEGT